MIGEFFDPQQELLIQESCRPHWSQAGAIVFVTWRTADSIPQEVLGRWEGQKLDWLARRGYTADHSSKVSALTPDDRRDFAKQFNTQRERFLDRGVGRCLLSKPELAQIVADSLCYFDGQRYRMGDFVVMPNHVHLLCAFATPEHMLAQFDSWQHFTARQINQRLGESGKFWQGDPFDHLVRSPAQYEYLRNYIATNPARAQLRSDQFYYRRYAG